MTKEQTKNQRERDSRKCERMPSEEALLELFQSFVYEYSYKRNLAGIRNCLSPDATAIGSATGEFWTNPDDLLASLEKDVEKIPQEMELFNQSFRVERLNDTGAVIWGRFGIRGKTADGNVFENPDCQVTAVYCLKDGKPLICHMHGSQMPPHPLATNQEPWPLHALNRGQHETAELYRLLFDNSPVGILHYDSKGMLKDCNQKFLKIVGSTRQKVSGMNLLTLPDKEAVECIGHSLKGRMGSYEGFYSSVTVNKITPIRVITAPIFANDSTISGGIAIFEDIGEHRVTQDRLQYQLQFEKMVSSIAKSLVSAPIDKIDQVIENALQLSACFFDAERGYIFQVDAEGKTLTNTHEWCAASEKPLMPKYQQYPLELLPAVLAFDRHAIEYLHFPDVTTMPEAMADFKKILIEDRVKSMLLLPMLAQGKFIGLFGYDCVKSSRSWTSEEITLLKVIAEMFSNALYKKSTEKQIRENEEKHRFLAENINDVIWIFDVETLKYSYISPSLTRIFGYTPEELIQSGIVAHLSAESLKTVLDYVPERIENLRKNRQTRYTEELEQITKDGRRIQTELTQNWVINLVTGHAEIIGITRDITERKELEEQNRLLEIHRQQSLKADSLGRMAGSIAHHFNNQLQVILGNLELMAFERQKNGTSSKNISDAMRATHKASEMSSLMLTYLGQHQSEGQISNLRALCNSQMAALRDQLPAAHQLILNESAPDERVNINRDHFSQILKNLVINASEACRASSGTITIDITKVLVSNIPARHRFPPEWVPEHECYICLQVQDNGIGIPEDDVYKTFDPFFSTKGPGRGLGLANALGFMRSVDGGIALSTQPDQGSKFSFYFPCVKGLSGQSAPAVKKSSRQACKMILVVEDEQMVRFITRSILENFDYQVIEAENGVKALEIFKALKGQIDLVICDLVMPEMDGWQTLEALRAIAPEIPVILASGYDQDFVMRGEHQQKPQAFLRKPYNSISLQQAIAQAISQ
ncbi:MAG TPA: hypothetical protein DCG57_08635 [Candidatus Riflebacteria bacterium]|nr:hypothetical protein [Candidatus Riflebacteria bacterium]